MWKASKAMSILHNKDCPLNLYAANTEEVDYYKIDFSCLKNYIKF